MEAGATPVHPRARGEQREPLGAVVEVFGSSPRTRGTGRCPACLIAPHRFIPAHAGNSRCNARAVEVGSVHPRARGEQACSESPCGCHHGSSPRTRGTGGLRSPRVLSLRFIPAHAGNRPSNSASPWPAPVHPRARGEQSSRNRLTERGYGSSPRTRGTGCRSFSFYGLRRFIPAHAGNRRPARVF